MKKAIESLKQVIWPSNEDVGRNFVIVSFGIVSLVILFLVADYAIGSILDKLYT